MMLAGRTWLATLMSLVLASIGAIACVRVAAECPTAIVEVVTGHDASGDDAADPPTGTDGGVEPLDGVGAYAVPQCASACANLARLRCPEGKGRAGEDSCYVVCKRAVSTRGRIDLKPECVAAAKSVSAVRACETYRCVGVP